MRSKPLPDATALPGLSIGDLADRTGVPAATLRSWEARHGVPSPQRLTGGHRRYSERDVGLVEAVLDHRTAGLSLQVAVERAISRTAHAPTSVFAGLRHAHPELAPQVLRKTSLLALTRAIEDECCARAEQPVLFASFQLTRFYDQSRARWDELARTARAVVVFADFPETAAAEGSTLRVAVPEQAPLRREWALVCDAPGHAACVAGWELPGQGATVDAERLFETVWTVDPRMVRDAAAICRDLADTFATDHTAPLADLLADTPPAASADLGRATSLLSRMISNLEGTY